MTSNQMLLTEWAWGLITLGCLCALVVLTKEFFWPFVCWFMESVCKLHQEGDL